MITSFRFSAMAATLATGLVCWWLPEAVASEERFSEHLKRWNAVYRMEFLSDGFPAKRIDGKLVPHPTWATTVIQDGLWRFSKTAERSFLDFGMKVADAAIGRAERRNGAMIWYFDDSIGVSRAYEKHYSALTQSQMMRAFLDLYDATDRPAYRDAADAAFRSLTIPVNDGGVLFEYGEGVTLAEIPLHPNGVILNGWLAAMRELSIYAERRPSEAAGALLQRNLLQLEKLLHLYDAPIHKISRYSLTGFVRAKVNFSRWIASEIDAVLTVPGEGSVPVGEEGKGRWSLYFFDKDVDSTAGSFRTAGRRVRMNLVLSRLSLPGPNRLTLTFHARRAGTGRFSLALGRYSPLTASPVSPDWVKVSDFTFSAGRNVIELDIGQEYMDLVGYPTNFRQALESGNHNYYHFMHISYLQQLGRRHDRPILLETAQRWTCYVADWPDLEPLQEAGVQLTEPRDGGLTPDSAQSACEN